MECLNCSETLVASSSLFFFIKGDKDVHLSIKPEMYPLIKLEKKLCELKDDKKICINCNNCSFNVGSILPFGPNGTKFPAFSSDKVTLCKLRLKKKEKWWNAYKRFELQVEQRDRNNWFGELKKNFLEENINHKAVTKTIFPSIDNLSLFEWYSVSLKRKPRKYQIQAFVEALQSNLIVVLETGGGKTLIASMLIGRMCEINPQKMGLMIVDRIPLVFQHAASISSDTNLKVVSLCGENKTKHTIKQINDGYFDVLVITAGAFYEMVMQKYINVNMFCVVVIDECHHATGGHKYLDVIQFFTSMPLATQPRILGLTASPINAKTFTQGIDQLQKFLLNFPSAKIFFPDQSNSKQNIIPLEFEYSENQLRFLSQVVEMFNKHLKNNIYSPLKISGIELKKDLLNSYQMIGDLRTLEGNYQEHSGVISAIKVAYIYIESLEMCAIMGVRTAYNVIKDNVKEICKAYENVNEDSARLIKLSTILRGVEKTSKVLIFVHTKNVARALYKFLCDNFGMYNPRMVFGHGGYDGMLWEGEQELAIRDFATGDCNLIVATSVLEEGLDVAECDVVISFTSIKSLIQFIQVRGRARKHGSKFYSFQTMHESKITSKIRKQEEILKYVLRTYSDSHCLFSNLSKEIIKKIHNQFINNSSNTKVNFDNKDQGSFSFLIYVETKNIDISTIKERLFEVLQECNEFQVKQLEIINTTAELKSSTHRVFTKSCIVFLVGVHTKSHSSTSLDAYLQFCRTFNFNIKVDDICICPSWTQFSIKTCNNEVLNLQVKSTKLGIGYFVDKTSCVVVKETPIENCLFSKKEILISYSEFLVDFVVKVPLTFLGNFALISIDKDYFSLNMVLLHAPYICKIKNNAYVRSLKSNLSEIFSKYSLLQITFPINKIQDVQQVLFSPILFPIPHFYVKLNCVQTENYCNQDLCKQLSESIEWYLGCIKDSRMLCLPTEPLNDIKNHVDNQISSELQRSEVLELCEAALKAVFSRLNKYSYFDHFFTIYENEFNHMLKIPISKRDILHDVVPSNCVMIKRVVATPTRIVMLPPVPVASNRMIRLLSYYNILIVSFRDEDMSKLHDSDTHDYISFLMKDGIMVSKSRYYFFATSASQLRDHKTYFIEVPSNNEVKNLRSKIVPSPEEFKNVAKYMSRLGLYATADMKTRFRISTNMYSWTDDLKAKNGELTTDGCGKISLTMCAHIANILKIDKPSALQIRFSGIKGILVCTNDDDPDLKNKPFAFRPSMKKFENNDMTFCITSYSKYNSLSLNREVINLLNAVDSNLFSKVLIKIQQNELQKMVDIFNNERFARNSLYEFFSKEKIDNLSIVNIHHERFWFSILQGIYRLKVSDLVKRSSIPVEKGCLLVGVADPIGILEEGEIFLQIEYDSKKEIITGDALVYRNPCLHPGDQRVVCCVDKPSLRYLVNVVVFPVKNCECSFAASCSGGDLDGDQFAIIWDTNLIPPRHLIYPRFDYSQLTLVNPLIKNVDVTDENVIVDFFMKFMKNDSLGRIAHKHLALCDFIENGARNPLAVELAKSQAAAVDYPKTGILPKVPEEALKLLKQHTSTDGYPDFMGKKISYPSKKILGFLYRECKSIGFNFDLVSKENIENVFGFRLYVAGYQEYMKDALEVYACYVHNIKMIMSRFELKAEADVVLGCATYSWSIHLNADRGKAAKSIAECYQALVKKFREIFFSDINDFASKIKKACAWYNLVNDKTIKIIGHNKKYLSFPWVISDVLCEVFQRKHNQRPSNFYLDIGLSALNYFSKSSSLLLKIIADKTKVLNTIGYGIQRFVKKEFEVDRAFRVSTYGSTSIYVCEPESDVDICIFAEQCVFSSNIFPIQMRLHMNDFSNDEKEKHILQFVISRALDSVVSSKREVLDAKIPIIKCVIGDEDSAVSCDISMNLIGKLKTQYIHFLYQSNCLYLPLFWILVSWARVVGLVKSAINSTGVMDTAEFYSLIIGLMNTDKYENLFVENNRYSSISYLYSCLDKLKKRDKHKLGFMLHTFFRKAANLRGNMVFYWPAPNIPEVTIDSKVTEKISIFAQSAFHSVSATKNINELFLHALKSKMNLIEYSIKLPLSVSYAMTQACSFHSSRLSKLTGAVVSITPKEGTKNLLVTAVGSSLSINLLRSEIRDLIHTNKALVLGVLLKKKSKYFMEGSSLLIVEGKTLTYNPILKFEASLGAFELLHTSNRKDSLYVETDLDPLPSWLDEEFTRFQTCIIVQMSKFPHTKSIPIDATVRYGCFYLIDLCKQLPDSTTCLKMSEINRSIERGCINRKKWNRVDYNSSSSNKRFQMINLKPATGTTTFSEIAMRVKKKKKQRCTGIPSAFTPSLLQCNTSDESAKRKLLTVYEKVLLECGYQKQSSSLRLFSPWKVSLNPSSSYEVVMKLSDRLEVLEIAERPLHWIHATFISCKRQTFLEQIQTNPDIRFTIVSQDPIKADSELYNAVYPTINGVRTLPISLKDGKPRLTLFGGKTFVNGVRHVELSKVMSNGSIDAYISYGHSFFGNELQLSRPFCELSLQFNTEKLKNSLGEIINVDLLNEFTKDFYYKSIEVRNILEKFLSQK
ncbi:uncharacterized protein LOC105846402 isoform X2 [Hydra vulgaris]|uniref:RNA-directed RNA polymerase n=1 Tax=Hydra vulgaris TaxID=6087 RepID=A0ABM4BJW7_HYDVU